MYTQPQKYLDYDSENNTKAVPSPIQLLSGTRQGISTQIRTPLPKRASLSISHHNIYQPAWSEGHNTKKSFTDNLYSPSRKQIHKIYSGFQLLCMGVLLLACLIYGIMRFQVEKSSQMIDFQQHQDMDSKNQRQETSQDNLLSSSVTAYRDILHKYDPYSQKIQQSHSDNYSVQQISNIELDKQYQIQKKKNAVFAAFQKLQLKELVLEISQMQDKNILEDSQKIFPFLENSFEQTRDQDSIQCQIYLNYKHKQFKNMKNWVCLTCSKENASVFEHPLYTNYRYLGQQNMNFIPNLLSFNTNYDGVQELIHLSDQIKTLKLAGGSEGNLTIFLKQKAQINRLAITKKLRDIDQGIIEFELYGLYRNSLKYATTQQLEEIRLTDERCLYSSGEDFAITNIQFSKKIFYLYSQERIEIYGKWS